MKRLVTALCALALTTAVAGTAFAGDCPFKAAKSTQTDVKGS
ncbi:hypothetical protein [Ancylobacter rudongensis]|jgi:hypothetical protein|uniref:Uncharacterized protein n=1 Tax=Ancylobacter rudongensis TaxID=177413 RepID=A0A1G4UBH2_9HYPH|nr:hypothetical protein [Ancylobacter rudongensis]SCW91002.1 hypothetical protein SAMN05660859_3684 [Ancylobacter rudongensis]